MTPEAFQAVQPGIPHEPGVYQYFDEEGKLLYVGKAKDLRKRVSSYFRNRYDSQRIRLLVRRIDRIDVTVVPSEADALLLENSLIKEHQPRYNIQLKDDKSFPFIVIKNERFPRIFMTRRLIDDGSTYLGPFTSVKRTRKILEFLRSLYPIRTCKLALTERNVEAGKFKVCLEYHLGNCLGPCEGLQSETEYDEQIAQVKHILKGNFAPVKRELKARMQVHAERLEFEQAETCRQRLEHIEAYQGRSTVVSPTVSDVDAFGMAVHEDRAFVGWVRVHNGTVTQTRTVEVQRRLEETRAELLAWAVRQVLLDAGGPAGELLLPMRLDEAGALPGEDGGAGGAGDTAGADEADGAGDTDGAGDSPEGGLPAEWLGRQAVPLRGDKRKLVELAYRNALQLRTERLGEQEQRDRKRQRHAVLEALQRDFRLPALPVHIECFDNSNFHGDYPVAACVVFRHGKPARNDYRHFHVKTVTGPDDFASMREIVGRRYRRLLEEGADLPQLVVIDGGKGQLGAAMEAVDALGIRDRLTVVGIAKKLEEIYYPGDPLPLHVDKRSPGLKVIQQLRNEAHRFAITFHRDRRSAGALGQSELEGIPGIGPKSREDLLRRFRSVAKLREAPFREVASVVGRRRAKALFRHLGLDEGAEEDPDGAPEHPSA